MTINAIDALNKLAIACDPCNETMELVRTIRAALSSPRVPDDLSQPCDLKVVPTYTAYSLQSPAVPVIDGLDEAIKDARSDTARYENGDACVCIEFYSTGHPGANAIIKAAQAYSSLSKDEKVDVGAINQAIRCLRWLKKNAQELWTMNCDEALLALEKADHFGFVPEVKL